MSEKRLYHVASIRPGGAKVCGLNVPLKEAVESAEYMAVGWKARAKSAYRWHMADGANICIERAENATDPELIAITVFERDDIEVDESPIPVSNDPMREIDNIRDYLNGTGQWFSARNKTAVMSQLDSVEERLKALETENAKLRAFVELIRDNDYDNNQWYKAEQLARDLLAELAANENAPTHHEGE